MEKDNKLPDGLNFARPKEGAPEYVKGKLGINLKRFLAWASENGHTEEWLNFDLLLSKQNNLYLKLNDWKKTATPSKAEPDF